MKINKYRVLSDAVEKGIEGGYYKARRHTDTLDEDQFKANIYHYVMTEICKYFSFDESDDEIVNLRRIPEDGC
jgi:hypothetical protein